MSTFTLDPDQVEQVFRDCLTDSEDGSVEVDVINGRARLDKAKLADHAELIAAMLLELPEQFRRSGGGGWSFLNACEDRHGNQWTGMHRTMAWLFGLGMGIGMVECMLPRDLWEALPGGMPYYLVKDAHG